MWRKRQACKRCRQLKVRCQFASPAATACVRCTKSNIECEYPQPEAGSNEMASNELDAHSARLSGIYDPNVRATLASGNMNDKVKMAQQIKYLETLIRDARRELDAITRAGATPLTRALALEFYTLDEATEFYKSFQKCAVKYLNATFIPEDMNKCDKDYPWTCMAMITIGALNKSTDKARDRMEMCTPMLEIAVGGDAKMSNEDMQLAMSLMATFLLQYGDRGISRLYGAHAATQRVLNMEKLDPSPPFGIYIGGSNIIALSMTAMGRTLRPLAQQYVQLIRGACGCGWSQETELAKAYMITRVFEAAKIRFRRANHISEVYAAQEDAIRDLTTLASNCKDPVPALISAAKIKIGVSALLLLLVMEPDSVDRQKVARALVNHTMNEAFTLSSIFSMLPEEHRDYLPTYVYILMEDVVVCVTILRYATFALGLDVDVNSDLIFSTVEDTWKNMALKSFLARQLFVSVIQVKEMSSIKIGVFNKATSMVEGPGDLEDWAIYAHTLGKEHTCITVSRELLLNILIEETLKTLRAPESTILIAPRPPAHYMALPHLTEEMIADRVSQFLLYL